MTDPLADALRNASSRFARNLSRLREARALSQAGLARLAGVPRSTVTQLESGSGNPSLQNLIRLSGALQVSIEELLAAPRAEVKLIRSAELTVVKRSQGVASIFKLLPDPIPGMEMDRMEIQPGGRMGGVPHVAGTKEYLTCLQGELVVYVAGSSFRLEEGDVLAFPGDQAHSYQNPGRRKAIGLSVVALAPVGV